MPYLREGNHIRRYYGPDKKWYDVRVQRSSKDIITIFYKTTDEEERILRENFIYGICWEWPKNRKVIKRTKVTRKIPRKPKIPQKTNKPKQSVKRKRARSLEERKHEADKVFAGVIDFANGFELQYTQSKLKRTESELQKTKMELQAMKKRFKALNGEALKMKPKVRKLKKMETDLLTAKVTNRLLRGDVQQLRGNVQQYKTLFNTIKNSMSSME